MPTRACCHQNCYMVMPMHPKVLPFPKCTPGEHRTPASTLLRESSLYMVLFGALLCGDPLYSYIPNTYHIAPGLGFYSVRPRYRFRFGFWSRPPRKLANSLRNLRVGVQGPLGQLGPCRVFRDVMAVCARDDASMILNFHIGREYCRDCTARFRARR